jgi:hypothetical protein
MYRLKFIQSTLENESNIKILMEREMSFKPHYSEILNW